MTATTVNGKLVNPVTSLPANGKVTITLVDYSDAPVIGFDTADQNEIVSSVQVVPSGTGAWTAQLAPNASIRLVNGQAHTAYRIVESGASATSTYWIIVTATSPAWVGNLVTTLIGAAGGTAAAMAVLGELTVGGDATIAGNLTLDGTELATPSGVTSEFLSGDGTWRTPSGSAGAVWHTGSDVPSSGLGANGDMYLRTNGDVYAKSAGSWGSPVANILGPAGATGAAGSAGATGATGAAGPGVATGGTAGQFLKKASSANFDTAFDGTHGESAIVGGPTPAHGYGTSGTLFSNMLVYWDGIQLMGPNATNGVGGLDLRGVAACGGGSFSYMVDAHPVGSPGIAGGSISGNYFGLATPNNGNNDVSYWQSVTVYGMTYGVILGEHTHISALRAIYCFDAIVVVGTFYSGPGALHAVTIGNASVESVTSGGNALIFVGQGAKCHIVLDTEDSVVTINDQSAGGLNTGDVYLVGSWGTLNLPAATSNVTIHDSTRPAGAVTAPSVPSTTVAHQNTFGRPAAVTVAGGTVTAVTVDGVATGVTSGTVVVPAGKSIALTYSAAPSWVWTLI